MRGTSMQWQETCFRNQHKCSIYQPEETTQQNQETKQNKNNTKKQTKPRDKPPHHTTPHPHTPSVCPVCLETQPAPTPAPDTPEGSVQPGPVEGRAVLGPP